MISRLNVIPAKAKRWLIESLPVSLGASSADDTSRAASLFAMIRSLLAKNFEEIIAVASGPSACNTPRRDNALYFATNDSFKIVSDLPFVYFLTDRYMVRRYLKLGIKASGLKATVLLAQARDWPRNASIARQINRYKLKYQRIRHEVFAYDLAEKGPPYDNWRLIENTILEDLDRPYKQFNSGFGLIQVAYVVARAMNLPLSIYGLDAGEGGYLHYDGHPCTGKSVVSERTRRKLKDLLDSMYQKGQVHVANFSFFHPSEVRLQPTQMDPSTDHASVRSIMSD